MKKILIILTLIGAAYFALFIIPNNQGAQDEAMLLATGQDEPVIYPILVHMLTPGKDIHETWWRLIIYGDYHYGYPFYLASFLVLLPVRMAYGSAFTEHTQLNLLLLRQFISALPMIVSAGLLTYLQTRFKSTVRTILLFCLLLCIPGVVRNNIRWWHPDALAVLCVVLTLFFFDRDRLRFGGNFWLAAIFCGLATAIKLVGVYFFLVVPAYLAIGWILGRISLLRLVLLGLGFSLIMGSTAVVANPFLFYPSQRTKFLRIQAEKQVELDKGYTHDDPAAYQKGPAFWVHTLSRWYGSPFLLLFLAGSLVVSSFFSDRPTPYWPPPDFLILAWCIPLSVYLLFFVAPKPDHYWLPVMVPLFSASTNLIENKGLKTAFHRHQALFIAVQIAAASVLLVLVIFFARQDIGLIQSAW